MRRRAYVGKTMTAKIKGSPAAALTSSQIRLAVFNDHTSNDCAHHAVCHAYRDTHQRGHGLCRDIHGCSSARSCAAAR